MQMPQPKIAAIVLQYGQWQKTAESVTSLLCSTLPPAWIIVVDNASPDDSAASIKEWLAEHGPLTVLEENWPATSAPIILLKRKNNGGYASGNNAGIALGKAFDADAFLLLNNDARLHSNALETMWRTLAASERPGLCGPLIVYPRSGHPVQCAAGGHTNYITGLSHFIGENLNMDEAEKLSREKVEQQLNFICGACVLASRNFVETVGPMDEGYFLYCEEQDWALRARSRFNLSYAPQAICFHHEGASTGWNRHVFQWSSGFRLLKSRLRLAWLHHPQYLPIVAVCCCFATARQFARRIASILYKKFHKG